MNKIKLMISGELSIYLSLKCENLPGRCQLLTRLSFV